MDVLISVLETIAIRAGTTAGTLARIELAQTSPEWRTVRSIAAAEHPQRRRPLGARGPTTSQMSNWHERQYSATVTASYRCAGFACWLARMARSE